MKFGYEWVSVEEAEWKVKRRNAPCEIRFYDDTKIEEPVPQKWLDFLEKHAEWIDFLEQHPDSMEKYNFKYHELDDKLGKKATKFLAWFAKFIPSMVYIEAVSKATDIDMINILACMEEIRNSAMDVKMKQRAKKG